MTEETLREQVNKLKLDSRNENDMNKPTDDMKMLLKNLSI